MPVAGTQEPAPANGTAWYFCATFLSVIWCDQLTLFAVLAPAPKSSHSAKKEVLRPKSDVFQGNQPAGSM